jgi:hypothetical protein
MCLYVCVCVCVFVCVCVRVCVEERAPAAGGSSTSSSNAPVTTASWRASLAADSDVFSLDTVVVAPAVERAGRERTLRARAEHIVHPDLRGPAAKGLTGARATNHSLKILENQCPSTHFLYQMCPIHIYCITCITCIKSL